MAASSPHGRGCFSLQMRCRPRTPVFPARAGVFPKHRGAQSALRSLPRTGGGVSEADEISITLKESSPHGRGCFQVAFLDVGADVVFPARAGVFLSIEQKNNLKLSLPRTGGGVSAWLKLMKEDPESSPHGRGCFQVQVSNKSASDVFPARAGVFLIDPKCRCRAGRLPRTGGGVSFCRILKFMGNLSSPHGRGCF